MIKYIYIASINRHGGSLLARLFDSHQDVASYPLETGFKKDFETFKFSDDLGGSPNYVPDFSEYSGDLLDFFELQDKKKKDTIKWGKETSDPVGVRTNYLEKAFYQNVKTNFDYQKYIDILKKKSKNVNSIHEIYDALHGAYFDSWDDGKHKGNLKFVVIHNSGGLYLRNFKKYFEEFKYSYSLTPIRDIKTYIASEKTRLARRFFGARRFQKPNVPNFLVKSFSSYDLDALIRTWLVSITRIRILQEIFGFNNAFLVYRYEDLVQNTEILMRDICSKLGLIYNEILLKPTIGGFSWLGNSHSGAQKGINLSIYYDKVLNAHEINEINKKTKKIIDIIYSDKNTLVDLTKINSDNFYDYKIQKSLCGDEKMWAIYSAFAFRGYRSKKIETVTFISIIAYIFSKFIFLINIPRILKLKFFPGVGKQNYT
jgi:hypothetical protein